MEELLEMADAIGVTVEYAKLESRDGEYRHDLKRIRLRDEMTFRKERSVLAHELAHAIWEDVPSRFGPVNARQERRADEWAALRLITLDGYRESEQRWDGHIAAMAYDLAVTVGLVKAFQRILHRIGDTSYVAPRMGVGQWVHKVEV
ncbi:MULTISPECIES: ImmA/IrrE family metallo-endopeptidase [unclassified Microbacterium]|uniref:ImmA/IrrE family metallo-endopeptidase n=1 Tax=unclassified Microbacterium TaxID=2609290 RepID=UPI001604A6F5|nr:MULTISPECIES: ImmA/IrrE family metallo-endopeptidase [unclassified Microbacterium]QNA93220.1 ImmA/IrrE family metallo-endopeptidase [Microbacterium sp. Se63.02b]QYM63428.1 ImmA/IrrE family metallo-endopeptidase [Microbacterium sp. Se5.02b]